MTGPENYVAAEKAIQNAADYQPGEPQSTYLLRVAQIRATLALAAATAEAGQLSYGSGPSTSPWRKALYGEEGRS